MPMQLLDGVQHTLGTVHGAWDSCHHRQHAGHSHPPDALFKCESHHYDTFIIHRVQNISDKIPNATYIILLKNPNDMSQARHWDRQAYPGDNKILMITYWDAMTIHAQSYMVLNFKQVRPKKFRLRNRDTDDGNEILHSIPLWLAIEATHHSHAVLQHPGHKQRQKKQCQPDLAVWSLATFAGMWMSYVSLLRQSPMWSGSWSPVTTRTWFTCLGEASNILNNHMVLQPNEKHQLAKHVNFLRSLWRRAVRQNGKKALLMDGGFLGLLTSPLAPLPIVSGAGSLVWDLTWHSRQYNVTRWLKCLRPLSNACFSPGPLTFPQWGRWYQLHHDGTLPADFIGHNPQPHDSQHDAPFHVHAISMPLWVVNWAQCGVSANGCTCHRSKEICRIENMWDTSRRTYMVATLLVIPPSGPSMCQSCRGWCCQTQEMHGPYGGRPNAGTYAEAYHNLTKSSGMYHSDLMADQFVGGSMLIYRDLMPDDSDGVAY